MTEREAAEKLAALIREIETDGHQVSIEAPNHTELNLGTGWSVREPRTSDEQWMALEVAIDRVLEYRAVMER